MRTKTEAGPRGRQGHTLIELVVATAVTMLVMSQVALALVASQRMFEAAMADFELSLQSRALRDKLLYRISDDGGLMNACQAELSLVNGNKNKGTGIAFKPKKGPKNKVAMNDKNRLSADLSKHAKWLDCGTMVFQGTNVFGLFLTNGTLEVDLDMAILISTRKYQQRNRVKAQIMNE